MTSKSEPRQTVRCAIYTRKSTDENLHLEFNSLDAQRESAEAYIASQRAEGWVCLPDQYDDGGYSGGNIERPALKRLLADIEAGKVDCIVVYKVDRLSRSLMDFARIMETFERHRVSFVSVTQQFNTTTSMGRLMLNVLLSFAQFEREIISERTRDKIAATRRKGKWSGGRPMLGYDIDPKGGRLLVNEGEAARVRTIFQVFLQQESLVATLRELDRRGWTTKRWVKGDGRERGGKPFDKSCLYNLLTNVLYLGKITYKDEVHAGEQPAILDAGVFQRVQALLQRNGRTGGKEVRNKYGALLRGILVCRSCNCAMVHSHTAKDKNRRYRYYVCLNAQKRGWHACPTRSVSAPDIERYVVDQIKAVAKDDGLLARTLGETRVQAEESAAGLKAEKDSLERELKRHNADVRKLAGQGAQDAAATARLADLQERMRVGERRLTEVREELLALGREMVDERELAAAFTLFDPVWETLCPREQARVLSLLIERVAYDGVKDTVAITFRPTGIKTLAEQLAGK